MKIREVIEKILEYHPHLEGYKGCDDYKCGDPEQECTGVVTAMVPNVAVIRKAIERPLALRTAGIGQSHRRP